MPAFYRVSKYDPRHRNSSGHFTRETWTSISDIGRCIGGLVVQKQEYLSIENAYLESVRGFCSLHSGPFRLMEFECYDLDSAKAALETEPLCDIQVTLSPDALNLEQILTLRELEQLVILTLRERLWCELGVPGQALIRFGYDYYMYFASRQPLGQVLRDVRRRSLFVENIRRLPGGSGALLN